MAQIAACVPRTCARCGILFPDLGGRGRRRKYCTAKCATEAARVLDCVRHAPYEPAPLTVHVVCKICDRPFSYERQPGRSGRWRRFCSEACSRVNKATWGKAARAEGRYRERERIKEREVIGERACTICGKAFLVRRANPGVECCGLKCGNRLAWERSVAAGTYRGPPEKIYTDKKSRVRNQNVKRRLRLRGSSITIDRIDRNTIFERDGWRCGLCHKRVDKKLVWPHPKSASEDHIIPISDGGLHIAANLQCAHLICNLRKNNGAGGQLRLFG